MVEFAVEAAGLLGEIAIEIAHEVRKLSGTRRTKQEVVVIREKDEDADLHLEEPCSARQEAEDDCVQLM